MEFGLYTVWVNVSEIAVWRLDLVLFIFFIPFNIIISRLEHKNCQFCNYSYIFLNALYIYYVGKNIKQLCQNILSGNPVISSLLQFSPSLRELVKELLLKNSQLRPSINAILSRSVIKDRISSFLNQSKRCIEFSHTGMHYVLSISAFNRICICIDMYLPFFIC